MIISSDYMCVFLVGVEKDAAQDATLYVTKNTHLISSLFVVMFLFCFVFFLLVLSS